jgi:hypothetical protein
VKRQVSSKERALLHTTLFGGSPDDRETEALYYEEKIDADRRMVEAEKEGAARNWRERCASWKERHIPEQFLPYWLKDWHLSALSYRCQALVVLVLDLVFAVWYAMDTLEGDAFSISMGVGISLVGIVAGHTIAGWFYLKRAPRRTLERMERLACFAAFGLILLLAAFAFARPDKDTGATAFNFVCALLSAGILPFFGGVLYRISQAHAELNELYALYAQLDSEFCELTMLHRQILKLKAHQTDEQVHEVPVGEVQHAEA